MSEDTLDNVFDIISTEYCIYPEDIIQYGLFNIIQKYYKCHSNNCIINIGPLPRGRYVEWEDNEITLYCEPSSKVNDHKDDLLAIYFNDNGEIDISPGLLHYANNVSDYNWFAPILVTHIPKIQMELLNLYQWYCSKIYYMDTQDEDLNISRFEYDCRRNIDYIMGLDKACNLNGLFYNLVENGTVPAFKHIIDENSIDQFIDRINKVRHIISNYNEYKQKYQLMVKCDNNGTTNNRRSYWNWVETNYYAVIRTISQLR